MLLRLAFPSLTDRGLAWHIDQLRLQLTPRPAIVDT